MTKPLDLTNRQLLEQIAEHAKVHDRDAATIKMLAHTVDRLIREKEAMMALLGRAMVQRLEQAR